MVDPIFADQSMTLYITYNLVQITIHRTFLPPTLGRLRLLGVNDVQPPMTAPSQAMTSLAISANAAKSIARFLEVMRHRGLFNESILLPATELSVAILCLNVWVLKARQKARRLKGLDPSLGEMQKIEALLEDVHSLMEGLKWAVPKWGQAGEIRYVVLLISSRGFAMAGRSSYLVLFGFVLAGIISTRPSLMQRTSQTTWMRFP